MVDSRTAIRAVVAIDFGTSRSGYAYAFIGEKKDPECHYQWPAAPVPYEKASTHLLYSPEGEVEAWGYPATQRYAALQRDANVHEYAFFQNFKMALHEKKTRTWDDQPISIKNGQRIIIKNGREFSVLDLVADYLSELKKYILADLRKQTSGHLWDHEILWCLTIPAIWTDADKQLMRDAAQKAELIGPGKGEAERLVLVLEPEAAAIHCLHKDTSVASSALRPDTTFMVIDAGGGTIDITTHKIAVRGKHREFALKEVISGTGDAYGSIYVDKMFQKFLEEKFGAAVWREFYEKEPLAALDMMANWERQKCNFDHRQSKSIFIPISARLYKYLKNNNNDGIEHLEAMPDDNIELENEMMREIFRPALDGVVREVEKQFESMGARKCDFIFLVGGFASSRLLQERIEQEFGSKVKKVVIPTRPGAAILLGAVSFGLDPSLIRSRRTRLTYGVGIRMDFDPHLDPQAKKVTKEEGGYWCEDRFSIFVKAGDGVGVDQAIKRTYYPCYADQEEMLLECYATPQQEVRYTDEEGCAKIGELTISRDDTSSGKNWPVEVTMYFGKTEIKVEAKDKHTGHVVETHLRFSSMYVSSLMVDQDNVQQSEVRDERYHSVVGE